MHKEEVINRTKQHMDRLLRKMIEEKSKLDEVDFDSDDWDNQKERLHKITREWQSFLDSLP